MAPAVPGGVGVRAIPNLLGLKSPELNGGLEGEGGSEGQGGRADLEKGNGVICFWVMAAVSQPAEQ